MHEIFILLGSNKGFRYKNLLLAQYLIQQKIGEIVAISNIYETEPWQVSGKQSAYLNQCIAIKTNLSIFQVLNKTQKIEKELGRTQKRQNQSRTIDIDILFFDDWVINTKNLIIPHPRLHLRKFTLQPLAEIAATFTHPILNETIETLNKQVADNLDVKLYSAKVSLK